MKPAYLRKEHLGPILFLAACLAVLPELINPALAAGQTWYVSPAGRPQNSGDISAPIDLATALDGKRVGAGSTIWLRGGTYFGPFTSRLTGTESAPITVQQYAGERATLVGRLARSLAENPGTLNVFGAWTIYRDFEVTNTNPIRTHDQDFRPTGVFVQAPHTKFINLIVHDTGIAFGFWKESVDSELYGNIIYNSGTQNTSSDKRHGHAVYTDNIGGTKVLRDNVMFNQFGLGIQIYAVTGALQGFDVEGNVLFNSGVLTGPNLRYNNIMLMGYQHGNKDRADRINISGNYTYEPFSQASTDNPLDANVSLGCPVPDENGQVAVLNNYFAGGRPVVFMCNWTDANVTGNTFVGPSGLVRLVLPPKIRREPLAGHYKWDNNHFFEVGSPSQVLFIFNDQTLLRSFAEWRRTTVLDGNSTYSESRPKGTNVFIRPNQYQMGRANIVIYNWDLKPTVDVDVSSVMSLGKHFEIRNVQDYFGPPVLAGVFDGHPLQLPMSELSTAKPTGWTNSAASTGPEFNVFVLSTVPELQPYDGARKATMTRPPRRSSEQSSQEKPDLQPFMGVYESSDRKRIAVIASDGILTAVSASEPGQPAYRLEPMASDRFHLEGMPEGFVAQFDLKDGKPAGLTLLRGSFGSIVFTRLR